jgi:predicted RNase H-like HicB family nuclease
VTPHDRHYRSIWLAEDGETVEIIDQTKLPHEFKTLRRKTLYLGLSDGARLDQLRRSSPELSHEQFWLAPELGDESKKGMVEKLSEAIEKQGLLSGPSFERVVFVDDFYGSGASLIRMNTDGTFSGKLAKARKHLEQLRNDGIVADRTHVTVVVYIASAQAESHIRETIADFERNWSVRVIQRLPEEIAVTEHYPGSGEPPATGAGSVDDEDGVWVVTVPALPGCFSQGDTKEEALEHVKEAIRLHLQGTTPIPIQGVQVAKVHVEG